MSRRKQRPSRIRTLGRIKRYAARCKWQRDYAGTTVLWSEFNAARHLRRPA